jgi:hypothetical protein
MNELYSNWPSGRPQNAIFGFGGCFGVSRLQRGFDENKTPGEVLEMMMQYICTRKKGELALVGLMKDSQGVVVLKVNGHLVTCLDPEHWCCIMFLFTERMLGGTQGLGSGYHVTSTHCHPGQTLSLPREIAEDAVKQYWDLVDRGEWQKMAAQVVAEQVVGASGDLTRRAALDKNSVDNDSDEECDDGGRGYKSSRKPGGKKRSRDLLSGSLSTFLSRSITSNLFKFILSSHHFPSRSSTACTQPHHLL